MRCTPSLAEEEAINRAISLSKLANAPLMIVHVSTLKGAELVARAEWMVLLYLAKPARNTFFLHV